ncbi:MAG TPA: hypothetical protein VFL47_13810 [Flavisolibacter sp.]|nr:hypothetical protein [Flavisolibacter sp.]
MTIRDFSKLDFIERMTVLQEAVCVGSEENTTYTALLYQYRDFYMEVHQHKKFRYLYRIEACSEERLMQYRDRKRIHPDLQLNLTRFYRNFTLQCRQLMGETVSRVEYNEVKGPDDAAEHQELDSVDSTISLFTKSGHVVLIGSRRINFYPGEKMALYRLDVQHSKNPVLPKEQHSRDVSQDAVWKHVAGSRIADVKVFWEKAQLALPDTAEAMDYHYPQALALLFSNGGEVFISAAELLGKQELKTRKGVDNLLVTASPTLALQTRMLSLANNYRVSTRRLVTGF